MPILTSCQCLHLLGWSWMWPFLLPFIPHQSLGPANSSFNIPQILPSSLSFTLATSEVLALSLAHRKHSINSLTKLGLPVKHGRLNTSIDFRFFFFFCLNTLTKMTIWNLKIHKSIRAKRTGDKVPTDERCQPNPWNRWNWKLASGERRKLKLRPASQSLGKTQELETWDNAQK